MVITGGVATCLFVSRGANENEQIEKENTD